MLNNNINYFNKALDNDLENEYSSVNELVTERYIYILN